MSRDPSSAELRIAELERQLGAALDREAGTQDALDEMRGRIEALTIALRDLVSHGSHLNAEQRASLARAQEELNKD